MEMVLRLFSLENTRLKVDLITMQLPERSKAGVNIFSQVTIDEDKRLQPQVLLWEVQIRYQEQLP